MFGQTLFVSCINGCRRRNARGDLPVSMGALMGGMLILTVVAFFLVAGIAVITYRKRKTGSGD